MAPHQGCRRADPHASGLIRNLSAQDSAWYVDFYAGRSTHLTLPGEAKTANNGMWEAPDVVPAITYSDVPRAVEWLERVFGFHERADARLSWPGGGLAWIEVGGSLFSITTPDETWPKATSTGQSSFVMKVYVDDLDRHFARTMAEGATIISEPQDGFWGGRTYRALDHEGNRWEMSQRGRDLAPERWQLPPGVTRGVSR